MRFSTPIGITYHLIFVSFSEAMAGERLKLNREFYDEKWSKNRIISSLDWSTQHPELLLGSYSSNEDTSSVPDGVALIWNIRYKKDTPEYIFHCQVGFLFSLTLSVCLINNSIGYQAFVISAYSFFLSAFPFICEINYVCGCFSTPYIIFF